MTGVDCITALRALGEVSRIRIVNLLLEEGIAVGEIARRLGLPQYNVSKHLRVLEAAGLVQIEKRGRQRLCMIPAGLRSALGVRKAELDLGCCTFHFDKLPR